jgi:hypothetical protein
VFGEADKLKDWKDLEASLNGAFSARAKGFLGSKFSLSASDGEFGVLRLEGSGGASFEVGGIEGRIEPSGSRRRMSVGDEAILTAGREGSGLWIEVGGAAFDANMSLLRNTASARSAEGREVARVSGGISNRSYEASFGEGSMAVAVFLLFHLAATRRRAFRASTATPAGR